MYNLLCRKYTLTKSKRLVFIKHRYNKKEYVVKLIKKNINFYLKEGETYGDIVNEILKMILGVIQDMLISFVMTEL